MGAVLWLAKGPDALWMEAPLAARWLHLAWALPAGAAAYFIALLALGFRLRHFVRRAA